MQYPRAEENGVIPMFEEASMFGKTLKLAHGWSKICEADTVSKMNDHVREETTVDFINMCETKHNDMLCELGNAIQIV